MSSPRAHSGTRAAVLRRGVLFWLCCAAQTVTLAAEQDVANPFNAPICQKRKMVADAAANQTKAMPAMSVPPDAATPNRRRIKFYRNPMGLADTSLVPKKDQMGMDYIPVYEDEGASERDQFGISPVKIQRTGIEFAVASKHEITTSLKAPATVELDEQRVFIVAPRFEGFIETAGSATTGMTVKKGDVLATAYSPEIVNRGAWLLIDVNTSATPDVSATAPRTGAALAKPLITPARRLQELGAPDEFIEEIKRERRVPGTIAIRAPRDGVVLERNASAGQALKSGDAIFKVADLSAVWVVADVPEADIEGLQAGQDAKITTRAFPGHVMHGTVSLVYPQVSKETRTARVRIELANEDLRLKPGMYADVEIAKGATGPAVTVPMGAVLDSGDRETVFLSLPEGRFEAREVKTGRRGDGRVEILSGLAEGESIVANGNFLVDAESNLQSAIKTFSQTSNAEARR